MLVRIVQVEDELHFGACLDEIFYALRIPFQNSTVPTFAMVVLFAPAVRRSRHSMRHA